MIIVNNLNKTIEKIQKEVDSVCCINDCNKCQYSKICDHLVNLYAQIDELKEIIDGE